MYLFAYCKTLFERRLVVRGGGGKPKWKRNTFCISPYFWGQGAPGKRGGAIQKGPRGGPAVLAKQKTRKVQAPFKLHCCAFSRLVFKHVCVACFFVSELFINDSRQCFVANAYAPTFQYLDRKICTTYRAKFTENLCGGRAAF